MQNDEDDLMTQLIDEIPTMTEAIRFCVRAGRLTDKQVYLELGIDAGQWTRIMQGTAHFPQEKLLELMRICRNDAPLMWLAKQRGYNLRINKESFEELLQKEREEKLEIQKKLDSFVEILRKANISLDMGK